MRLPEEEDLSRREESAPHEFSRTQLERILLQLQVVEMLYLRLIGLQTQRLAQPELEAELAVEAAAVQSELRAAHVVLDGLGHGLWPENNVHRTRQGF